VILPERGNDDTPYRLTSSQYVRRCLSPIVPHLTSSPTLLFIQDGASCHTAAETLRYLERKQVRLIKPPPRSPDLNVIENLWSYLQTKVSQSHPRNREELIAALKVVWAEDATRVVANKLVDSFHRRVDEVIAKKGGR
jgi:transposase